MGRMGSYVLVKLLIKKSCILTFKPKLTFCYNWMVISPSKQQENAFESTNIPNIKRLVH